MTTTRISVRELMFQLNRRIFKANKELFENMFLKPNPNRLVEINKDDLKKQSRRGLNV